MSLPRVVCFAALIGACATASESLADDRPVPAGVGDVAAVTALLRAKFAGKSWDYGPKRIDSKFIRAAYPGYRFYAATSGDEPPPGANIDSIQEGYQHRKKVRDEMKIDAVVAFDANGNSSLYADVNAGLRPVKLKSEVRTACYALASLASAWLARPAVIEEKDAETSVTRQHDGWACVLTVESNVRAGVVFDASGKCASVDKSFIGPMPP